MNFRSRRGHAWLLSFLAAIAFVALSASCAGRKPSKAPTSHRPASAPVKKPELPSPPAHSPVMPGEPDSPRHPASPPPLPPPPTGREKEPAPDRIIRVLVAGPVKSFVTDGSPIRVWKEDDTLAAEWKGTLTIAGDGGRIRVGGMHVDGSVDIGCDSPYSVAGRRLPAGRVRVINRQGKLLAVAALPLEEYVAAVLSREASPSFDPAALAALAVAVRTYAVNAASKPRDPAYDLLNGVDDQVFDGFDRVHPQFRAAAAETRGLLLWHGDAPARANYHSTCGGRTENAADAWGKPFPYLVSVPCGDCRDSPAYRWEYRMTFDEGRRIAQSLGLRANDDLRFEVVATTASGRAARIRIRSGNTTREIAAAPFRQSAGTTKVKSLVMEIDRTGDGWKISGTGYGHGVGLCQWGAEGMARRGCDYREILARYYPGTRISGEAT